jgi:hypothetical protein
MSLALKRRDTSLLVFRWLGAGLVIGLTLVMIAGDGLVALKVVAGVAVFGALLLWPTPTALAVLVLVESSGNPQFQAVAPAVLTLGHRFYDPFHKVEPTLILLLVAIVAELLHRRPGKPVLGGAALVPILTAFGLAASTFVWWIATTTEPLRSRLLLEAVVIASPWLVFIAAVLLVRLAARNPSLRTELTWVLTGTLTIKLAIGLYELAATGGVTFEGTHHILFYDPTVPLLGTAAFLGCYYTREVQPSARLLRWWIGGAGFLILILSFRRSLWIMAIAGVLAGPLLERRDFMARRLLLAVLATAAALLALPGDWVSPVMSRVSEVLGAIHSDSVNTNAALHLKDILHGIPLVVRHPITGLGIRANQPPGLALPPPASFYIHNDLLYVWLTQGLGAAVLLVALFVSLARRGWEILSARPQSAFDAGAAATVAFLVLPCMTAAYLSDTVRFPAVVGLAAGLTLDRVRTMRADSASRSASLA